LIHIILNCLWRDINLAIKLSIKKKCHLVTWYGSGQKRFIYMTTSSNLEVEQSINRYGTTWNVQTLKELNLKRNIKFWSIEFQMTDLWYYILFHLDIKFLMRIMLFFLKKLTFLQIQIKCNFITHLWAPVFFILLKVALNTITLTPLWYIVESGIKHYNSNPIVIYCWKWH
jgi:hypothetical protein